eukprot:gb/GECG01010709.1/.p1 GENE.gb/GECG01010709.1/~~gb/GECG01010709.1/.p1  ORF type:complete len:235 (+),score=36.36 gb/GECG01010709.1/:1-705(+)
MISRVAKNASRTIPSTTRQNFGNLSCRYAHTLMATDPKFILNYFVVQTRQEKPSGVKPFVRVEVSDQVFEDIKKGQVKQGTSGGQSGPSSHWKVGGDAIKDEEKITEYTLEGIHDCESGYTCLVDEKTAENTIDKIRQLTPESDDLDDRAAEEVSAVKACEKTWGQFLDAIKKKSKSGQVTQLPEEFSQFLFIGHLGPATDMNSVALFTKGTKNERNGILLYAHNAKENADDMF